MRENGGLNFYRNLMKHEVTVDRNKTAPKCRLCCYYHPDFKYRRSCASMKAIQPIKEEMKQCLRTEEKMICSFLIS